MTLLRKSLLVAGLTVGLNVAANAGDHYSGVKIAGEEVTISDFNCFNDQVMRLKESIETRQYDMDQSKPDESKYTKESGEWISDDLKNQYMVEVKKHEKYYDPEKIKEDSRMLGFQFMACLIEYCNKNSKDGLGQSFCAESLTEGFMDDSA